MFNPVLNLTDTFNSLVSDSPGNALRVYLRVRPQLAADRAQQNQDDVKTQVEIIDDHSIIINAPTSSNAFKNSSHGVTKVTQKLVERYVF